MKIFGHGLSKRAGMLALAALMLLGARQVLAVGAGSFQANPLLGTANYNIPIETPPGTNGVGPSLALIYDSGGGNGWIGQRWSLTGLGYVERLGPNYSPSPTYTTADTYRLILGNANYKLVYTGVDPSGATGNYYRTQVESFLRIWYDSLSGFWNVRDKAGNFYRFGAGSANQQYVAGVPTKVFRWYLDYAGDPHGLSWTVSYYQDLTNGDMYPKQIVYTQGPGLTCTPANLAACRTVDFVLTPRDIYGDVPVSYRAGGRMVSDQLLERIDVKMGGQIVRSYLLEYILHSFAPGRSTSKSTMLLRFYEFGANGYSYPYHEFTYNKDANGVASPPATLIQASMTGSPAEGPGGLLTYPFSASNCTYTIDLNSDGLADVLVGQANSWYYYPNLGNNGFGAKIAIPNPPNALPSLCPGTVSYQRYYTGSTVTKTVFGNYYTFMNSTRTSPGVQSVSFRPFSYSGHGGWNYVEGFWTYTEPAVGTREIIHPVRNTTVVDVDGDMIPDILHSPAVGQWYWWRGLGNGQFADRVALAQGPSDIQLNDPDVRMVDIDSDGLPDIVKTLKLSENTCYDGPSDWQVRVYRNQGRDASGALRFTAAAMVSPTLTVHVADPDATPAPCDHPKVFPSNSLAFVDMNGDGLPDLVWFVRALSSPEIPLGSRRIYFYPNQGAQGATGWSFAPKIAVEGPVNAAYAMMQQTDRWTDINGDGLPDLLLGNSDSGVGYYRAYTLRNGLLYLPPSTSSYLWIISLGDLANAPTVDLTRENYMSITDLDGDGYPDILQGSPGNYRYWKLNMSDSHQMLEKVRTPIGGSHTFSYQRLRSNGTIRWVLNQSTANDGLGQAATTSYGYGGGLFTGWPNNEFRGYANTWVYDPPDHNGLRHYTATTYYQDDAKKGLPSMVDARSNAGALYTRTNYNYYATTAPAGGVVRADLAAQIVNTYDGTASPKVARTDYANYDIYGNARQVTTSGTGAAARVTATDFVYNTSAYMVSRPSHTLTTVGTTKIAESWFDYDGQANGVAPYSGNLTKETRWLSGGTNTAVQYFYNVMGSVIGTIDAKGNTCATYGYTNRIIYDSIYRTFPVSETNALCQTVTKTYWGINTSLVATDAQGGNAYVVPGLLATVTDANGVRADTYWDGFSRLYATVVPPDTASFPTVLMDYGFTYGGGNTGAPAFINEHRKENDWQGSLDQSTYLDGLGRIIQTKSEAETSSQWVTQDSWYNARGLVESVTMPYISYNSSHYNPYTPRDATKPKATILYDVVRRPIRVTNPDNTYSRTAYSPYVVASTDEKFLTTTRTYDALARLVSVVEPAGGGTTYYYHDIFDVSGNAYEYIADAQYNWTYAVFDTLGRKKLQKDPDLGTWNFTYDANANLLTQTDAKAQTLTYAYDKLNRLYTKTYPNSGGVITCFYDDATVGTYRKGRLWKVTDLSGSTTFTYDVRGRQTKVDKLVTPSTYATQYTYDSLDRLATMTYPNNEVLTYSYNAQGLLDKASSSTGVNYIANLDYNALGKVTTKTAGNSKVTSYSYHPQNFRLTGLSTPGLQNLIYGYDNAGNITGITDTVKANSQTFVYDNLDRLIGAASTAAPSFSYSYTYDSIGNMKTGAGRTFTYPAAGSVRPHAATSDGLGSYTYDNNGNTATRLLFGITRTFVWNYDNRLTQIKDGTSVTASYAYDFTGTRVKKVEGTTTTLTPFAHYRLVNGAATRYYFANGQRVAERDSGGNVFYYHSDQIGSSNVVSNSAGTEVGATLFYPYGATRSVTGTKTPVHRFTGQELDGSNLYYYGARYYDPVTMRFISADSIVSNLADPQTLNHYAYARGNPVKYVDPDGHVFFIPEMIYGGIAGAVGGAIAGYAEDSWRGLIIGSVAGAGVGATVGAVTPWLSSRAGSLAATAMVRAGTPQLARSAAATAYLTTMSAGAGAGSASFQVSYNWVMGRSVTDNFRWSEVAGAALLAPVSVVARAGLNDAVQSMGGNHAVGETIGSMLEGAWGYTAEGFGRTLAEEYYFSSYGNGSGGASYGGVGSGGGIDISGGGPMLTIDSYDPFEDTGLWYPGEWPD